MLKTIHAMQCPRSRERRLDAYNLKGENQKEECELFMVVPLEAQL